MASTLQAGPAWVVRAAVASVWRAGMEKGALGAQGGTSPCDIRHRALVEPTPSSCLARQWPRQIAYCNGPYAARAAKRIRLSGHVTPAALVTFEKGTNAHQLYAVACHRRQQPDVFETVVERKFHSAKRLCGSRSSSVKPFRKYQGSFNLQARNSSPMRRSPR
jgi:hypothetical protein